MTSSDHLIWSNYDLDYDKCRDELEREYPDFTEDQRYRIMVEANDALLDDERCNLDIQLSQPILVVADLGLWNGRHSGYTEIESGNIRDCLRMRYDYATWYVDRQGDLRCDEVHHDGTNHYLYRAFRDSASDTQRGALKDKLYRGIATRSDIVRVTKRLGDEIGKVYGWQFPRAAHRQAKAPRSRIR